MKEHFSRYQSSTGLTLDYKFRTTLDKKILQTREINSDKKGTFEESVDFGGKGDVSW